jgi:hypothetical protein
MKGAHVLIHRRQPVTQEQWKAAQPEAKYPVVKPYVITPAAPAKAASFKVDGAIEGESLKVASVSAGRTRAQNMASFTSGKWSNSEQLFWSGAKPGDRLELTINVPREGRYNIAGALTKARDYATVQIDLDDTPLSAPIDLYSPQVTTTGELLCGPRKLSAGDHRLKITITGANASAAKSYMVGLDYLRLIPSILNE